MKLMTNTEVTEHILPENQLCMWQISPDELPKDMPPCALELHNTSDGLMLVQMFIEGGRSGDWYRRISGYALFKQIK